MKTYATVYLGSAFLALVGTPLVVRLARRFGWMDQPGTRKVHHVPVPRVGGLALAAATLGMVLPVLALNNTIGQAFREVHVQVTVLLISALFVFVVGLVDDLRSCPAKVKLVALVGAALAVCISGARIHSVSFSAAAEWAPGWWSWPITVLWIVGVTVAMNFMDGLDGLAAGIAAVSCAVIAVMSFYGGQVVMGVLMLAVLGSLSGFLLFNFNPARIFMGDCGSMFLGFMIAAGSVVASAKKSTIVGIAVPALALGVPILDALFTMVRRHVVERRSIFTAERGHIHHRLLDMGLQHRTAVLVIYAITCASAGIGMTLMICRTAACLPVFLAVVLALIGVFHAAGVVPLGRIAEALRRNAAISRKVREDRSSFEDAQLRLREAGSFQDWWNAVTMLAGKLEFDRLVFAMTDAPGHRQTSVWRRTPDPLRPGEFIHIMIPVPVRQPHDLSWFELDVRRNGSMETIGRRVMFFGRLIDECATACARQETQRDTKRAAEGCYEIQPPSQVPSAASSSRVPVEVPSRT